MSESGLSIVVVGGVAAGAKAAGRAKRVNRQADVLLIQDETEISYTACGQPYYLGGVIKDRQSLIIQRPDDLNAKGIVAKVSHRVESIHSEIQQVSVLDRKANQQTMVSYDRLILATGARPLVPKIPGNWLDGVVTLRSVDELDRFKSTLDAFNPKNAVILGAGYIGIELADNLSNLGISVCVVDQMDCVMSKMDSDMSQRVHQHLLKCGVEVLLNTSIVKINGSHEKVRSVQTDQGDEREADLVVIAVGVTPNVDLAKDCGLGIGVTGAISVNERMQTSDENIYAAGDCVESVHRLTKEPVWNPLGDIANLQGRIAGENAAGGSACFPGVMGTAIFKAFDLNVAMTGLTETSALAAGVRSVSATIEGRDRARYYPGAKPVVVKLLADVGTGKVLGAQAVGLGAVDKVIDIVATALIGGLYCEDLEHLDLAYAPPYSPVLSPVIVAAGVLAKQLTTV